MATSIATAAAMATNEPPRDSDKQETKPAAVSKDPKAACTWAAGSPLHTDKPSWAAVRDSPAGASAWGAVRNPLKVPIAVARARALGGKNTPSVQALALLAKKADGDVNTSGLDSDLDKSVKTTMLNPMKKDASGKDQVQKKDLYQIVAAILAATKRRRGEDSGGASPDKSDKRDEKEDEDNKKALKEAKSALRTGASSPHEWTGPDTPLRGFTISRKQEFVKVLLQVKADPNEADKNGVSVLHFAAFDNNPEMCRTLLAGKADVNVRDKHGQTPMFFTPNEKVCEVLSEFRADLTLTNLQGQTALHLAGRAGLADVLLWFMSRVAKATLTAHDQHGANALYYARNSGVKESVIRTIRTSNGNTQPARIVASESNFQDNSQLHRAGAISDKSDAENSQFDDDVADEDEPKCQIEAQRTEKYKALAAAAEKERATKQAIREVDVDSALVKIANSARDKGVRIKDYFKQWDFLLDKRIKRENLRGSLQQLGPDIDSQEFKAMLYLLDPNCTDFVHILELDDAIRTAVKRHVFLDAREKSRQNWAEKRGRFGEKGTHNLSGGKAQPGSPKQQFEEVVDNLSGYASSEDDEGTFKTKHHWKDNEYGKKGNTLVKAAVMAPAHARVVAAREKAMARSREWTKRKERGENFGYGVKKPEPAEEEQRPPESPVKMARDEANRNERQASAILRQKQIAERRDYLLQLKEQQQILASTGVDVQKAQVEGSWALAKTLRVQMSIAEVARSKEKDAAEAQKRVRKMMRSSINVEIGALNDAHTDKQRARKADKEAEKAAAEEEIEKTAAEVADMAAEAARQAILDLEAKAKMAAMINKADEVQTAIIQATAQEAFFCWRDEWKEVKAEKARLQAEAEAIEEARVAAEEAAEAKRLAEVAAAEAAAAKEAAAEAARQAMRQAAQELVDAKNALTANDDGCTMFAPADWCEGGRLRMCKNCGDPWTQHKGIIKQEEVDSCQEETLKEDLAEAEQALAKRQEELAEAERILQLSPAEDAAQAAEASAEASAEAPEGSSAAATDGEAAPDALEVVDKAGDNDKAAAVETDNAAAVQPDKEAAVQPASAAAVEPASEAPVQPDNEADDYDNEAGIQPDDEAAEQPLDVEGDTF